MIRTPQRPSGSEITMTVRPFAKDPTNMLHTHHTHHTATAPRRPALATAAALGLSVCTLLLTGCQSLDRAANLNRAGSKPAQAKPAQVDPANSGRPPAVTTAPEPGRDALAQGQRLLRSGQPDAALAEFEKAIAINPRLTVAYLRAGDIYREQGDYAAAETRYGAAAQVEPSSFDAQYLHGLSLQLLSRFSDAVRAYLRALTLNPNDFNANLNLATTYLQLGEPQQAVGYARRAVELDPKNAPARSNLGATYSALDQHAEAVAEYLQAAELAPLSGPLLLNLANSLGRAGRYEEMVNTLDQLTRTEPTAAAFERLGAGYFYLRKYPESLSGYRKAVEIDPNHFPAWNGIGVNLMNQWIFSDQRDEPARQEALAAWRRSLQIERNQAKIVELLGRYQK